MRRRAFLAGGLAGAALLPAACSELSHEEIREAWPPTGRFVEVNGLPVHYWEAGTGVPVVLVHGASGNLRDWTFDVAGRLAQSHRVIAFDRPGFGYSARVPERGWDPEVQAAHLRAAARALGAARPVVVGHSWGGALAMAWGLGFPDEVRGIVTVSGATMPFEGGVGWISELGASPLGPLVAAAVSTFATRERVAARVEDVFAPQPIPQGYLDHLGWPLVTRPDTFRYNSRDLVHLDEELAEQARRYPGLRVPVEILHGTADGIVSPARHAVPMHALLPQSRLTLLEGLGHMPHHFAGDALAAAVARLAAR